MNTIPLARISTDDDRPTGLKLDRSGYGYQRNNSLRTAQRTAFHDEFAWLEDNDSIGRGSPSRNRNSPSVPARSPFRIRDSASERSASLDSGSKGPTTPPDSPGGAAYGDARASLSVEIGRLWSLSANQQQQEKKKEKSSGPTSDMDDLLMQLVVSQAMMDAHQYSVLSFEQITDLKDQYTELQKRIAHLKSQLQIQKHVQDASRRLAQLDGHHSTDAADNKVSHLSSQLIALMDEEADTQRRLLEHTAGALCTGLRRAENGSIEARLTALIKRHDRQHPMLSPEDALRSLERILDDYASKVSRLERQLEEKKETRCRAHEQERSSSDHDLDHDLARLGANLQDFTRENSSSTSELQNRIRELEARLAEAQEQAKDAQERLEEQVAELKGSLADMEARCSKAESELAAYQQQMEEQRQEYEAQQALLRKTNEKLEAERAKMEDLERLVRDKTSMLDARDARINELEAELQRSKKGSKEAIVNDPAVQEAQRAFTAREEAWMAQSAAIEANFEGILKEFDRLTGTAMEFEGDRMRYEQRINELTQKIQELDAALTEERINKLGCSSSSEGPTTASLRREFRQLVNDMKAEHQRVLQREAEEKRKLENRLKDLKHEREMARYERINKGVQTHYFLADTI